MCLCISHIFYASVIFENFLFTVYTATDLNFSWCMLLYSAVPRLGQRKAALFCRVSRIYTYDVMLTLIIERLFIGVQLIITVCVVIHCYKRKLFLLHCPLALYDVKFIYNCPR